jgi:hypothetical protein
VAPLKFGTVDLLGAEAAHTELSNILTDGVRFTVSDPFMAKCVTGFVIGHYDKKK